MHRLARKLTKELLYSFWAETEPPQPARAYQMLQKFRKDQVPISATACNYVVKAWCRTGNMGQAEDLVTEMGDEKWPQMLGGNWRGEYLPLPNEATYHILKVCFWRRYRFMCQILNECFGRATSCIIFSRHAAAVLSILASNFESAAVRCNRCFWIFPKASLLKSIFIEKHRYLKTCLRGAIECGNKHSRHAFMEPLILSRNTPHSLSVLATNAQDMPSMILDTCSRCASTVLSILASNAQDIPPRCH